MTGFLGFLILALIVVAGLYVYFLPTIVASKRLHRNRTAITVLNVVLGWTLLGWVAALVWAYTMDVEAGHAPVQDLADRPEPAWMRNPEAKLGDNKAWRAPGSPPPLPEERTCPFCAESIKAAAIVCKHCGLDVPPLEVVEPSPEEVMKAEAAALGVIWSPTAERFMWRREFFKDMESAIAYAKANS